MRKAFSGLRAWLVQRFTAVWMLVFLLFVLLHMALSPPGSYDEWRTWVGLPVIRFGATLFFLSLLLHAWVGLRDVLIDYVRALRLRFFLLAALCLALVGLGLWVVQVLFRGWPGGPL